MLPILRSLCRLAAVLFVAFATIECVAKGDPKPTPKKCWAVLVGATDYAMSKDLQYSVDDIRKLQDKLIEIGFDKDRITCLTSGEKSVKNLPVKQVIQREIETICQIAAKGDLVLIALSGHGIDIDKKHYFCPADTNDRNLEETTVSIDWIYKELEKSDASFKLLIVDACREPIPGKRKAFGVNELPLGALEEHLPESITLLQSCSAGQFSYEDDALKHGIFSYYLLEGLSGKADANGDGTVTLLELSNYAEDKTKLHAFNKLDRRVQKPTISGKVEDFALMASPAGKVAQSSGKTEAFKLVKEEVLFDKDVRVLDYCVKPNGEILVAIQDWADKSAGTVKSMVAIGNVLEGNQVCSFEPNSLMKGFGGFSFSPGGTYMNMNEVGEEGRAMVCIRECSSGLVKGRIFSTYADAAWSHDDKYFMLTDKRFDDVLDIYDRKEQLWEQLPSGDGSSRFYCIYNTMDGSLREFICEDNPKRYGYLLKDTFACLNKDGLRLFDLKSGKLAAEISGDFNYDSVFGFSPDRKFLADDVQIWTVSDKRKVFYYTLGQASSSRIPVWDTSSRYVVFAPARYNAFSSVALVDAVSGKLVRAFEAGGERNDSFDATLVGSLSNSKEAAFSPNGKYLAISIGSAGNGFDSPGIGIFETKTGEFLTVVGGKNHRLVGGWYNGNSIITTGPDDGIQKLYRWTFNN